MGLKVKQKRREGRSGRKELHTEQEVEFVVINRSAKRSFSFSYLPRHAGSLPVNHN